MIELTGDHKRLKKISDSLRAVILKGCTEALMQAGLKGEGDAVKAIREQKDSEGNSWAPLSEAYLQSKIEAGQSENIYVATSSLFQSITSNLVKGANGNLKLRYGVRRVGGLKKYGGAVQVAVALEFGNPRIGLPARPLWRPAKRTMLNWIIKERPFQKQIALRLREASV